MISISIWSTLHIPDGADNEGLMIFMHVNK
jgi:hypothetical protein